MSTKKPRVPASSAHPELRVEGENQVRSALSTPGDDFDRRRFLQGGLGLALGLGFSRPLRAAPAPALAALLEKSEFVYVSPLGADGKESRCHGEVWYGWFDGDVVLITARSTWKGRAFERGLDQAKIWVGDHGIWKRWWGTNEAFRAGPSFLAKATSVRDDALMERLMKLYAAKYPAEYRDWEPKMRAGYASGDRLLLRYRGSF